MVARLFCFNVFISFLLMSLVTAHLFADHREIESEITLHPRNGKRYRDSAYSFKLESRDRETHKNYVDIVFEYPRLRINNYGGATNRFVDLGKLPLEVACQVDWNRQDWKQDSIDPLPGHSYAIRISEQGHESVAVFYVVSVDPEAFRFRWTHATRAPWRQVFGRNANAGESSFKP